MSLIGDIYGARQQSKAVDRGINAQSAATDKQIALQKEMYDTTRQDNLPALQARNKSLEMLLGMLGPDGQYGKPVEVGDVTQEPGYQFGMTQGQNALNNQLAARGMRNSGAAIKAGQRFSQDYAGTKYNDAWSRLQAGRSAQLNPLLSLAGAGQVGASTIAGAGSQYSNVSGNALSQFGDAQANAALAKGSIYPKMLNKWEGRAMSAFTGGFGG
jgi:hypothetical protein